MSKIEFKDPVFWRMLKDSCIYQHMGSTLLKQPVDTHLSFQDITTRVFKYYEDADDLNEKAWALFYESTGITRDPDILYVADHVTKTFEKKSR